MVLFSCLRSREQTVNMGNHIGILLYLGDIFLGSHHKLIEQLLFKRQDFVLCSQDFLFVFLQFLGNVALCLSQSLLTHPFLRNLILIGIAHFQIIAKHIVITYLQR